MINLACMVQCSPQPLVAERLAECLGVTRENPFWMQPEGFISVLLRISSDLRDRASGASALIPLERILLFAC